MVPEDLAAEVREGVKRLKEVQDKFLQTYKRLCVHHGGPDWRKAHTDVVFHDVRAEVVPVMEQVGMDHKAVQALCSWAEKLVVHQ
jgi:hypothetical protein